MPGPGHARFIDPSQTRSSSMLDNPVWHALSTVHAGLSESNGRAKRYLPEVSPLAATADLSVEAYRDLAGISRAGQAAGLLVEPSVMALPGLEIIQRLSVNQMVWEGESVSIANPGEVLENKDAPGMLALAQLTKPGPFTLRTIELGTYIGIHKSGKLAAMAGERMRMPGFTEVSAVCTHPDHRSQGYASVLVLAMVTIILQRGDVPFLHVATENGSAIKIYEKLGFRTRRIAQFAIVRKGPA
jgi:GNAT superfamily N-acetyltransferase